MNGEICSGSILNKKVGIDSIILCYQYARSKSIESIPWYFTHIDKRSIL